jgi:antitoxin component of RelBE/YafQ-DinJ toxin-antitoxin module
MSGKGTARRTVRVNDDLWRAAQEKADRTGIDVSEIIRKALAAWIAEDEETEQ